MKRLFSILPYSPTPILPILVISLTMISPSCRNEQVSDDPSLRLRFSCDTVSFDTVFTSVGSATKSVMVYNPNDNAVIISKVSQTDRRFFHINLDGENDLSRLNNIRINGKDSLILFVNVTIDPQDKNSPVLVEDQILFETNGNRQSITLEAYGQDVEKIRSKEHKTSFTDYTFTATKPYLIYDTLWVTGTLIMNSGARLYFHQGASLMAYGDVSIKNALCISDRLDNLFDSVPYSYTAGGWEGMTICHKAGATNEYTIDGLDIISAVNGLQIINEDSTSLLHYTGVAGATSPTPLLLLSNSRLHNHAGNGLTIHNMNALVTNTEISNCGQYCVYLTGGKHTFIHSTIAEYFNATNVRIQSSSKTGLGAVYIDNADSLHNVTAEFMNCVIASKGAEQITWADTLHKDPEARWLGNYIQSKEDTAQVFVNTYFEYKKYDYYDFHLAPLSPARGIADSTIATLYPFDKEGLSRDATKASAGCYEK